MKTYIIFIVLLDLIRLVLCVHYCNITENELYPVCPLQLLRRKRAPQEYTRWRANLETTSEFVVILDDDAGLTTKGIVAVNIQPERRSNEKVIIGGAVPLNPTPTSPEIPLKEYTRFIPPLGPTVTQINDLFLAPDALVPIGSQKSQPGFNNVPARRVVGGVRHPQRDESPPSGPMFLPRTSMDPARQYAPVSAAFNRQTDGTPVTPPTVTNTYITHQEKPTMRTTPWPPIIKPSRSTKSDAEELSEFQEVDIKDHINSLVTRTSPQIIYPSPTTMTGDEHLDGHRNDDVVRKFDFDYTFPAQKKADTDDKDVETYNMAMYNDDDEDAKKSQIEMKVKSKLPSRTEKTQLQSEIESDISSEQTDDLENKTLQDTESKYHKLLNLTEWRATFKPLGVATYGTTDKTPGKRDTSCNMIKLRHLSFHSPRTLPEIEAQLKQWAENSPVAKWVDITKGNLTTMENSIYMMIVDDPSSGQVASAKQTVMVVAGIQGRDHHAVAAAMYLLYQLIERNDAHSDLLNLYRFWIIPVLNPDGYDYSTTFPQRREWTKNLRQSWTSCKGCTECETRGLRCVIQSCYGVNLDRNFEYQWIPSEELRSEHPCGDLFAGRRQLSEPETQAFTEYLRQTAAPHTFVAFKEGDVLGVLYPYSHTRKKRAFDHVYRQRASRAAAAAYSITSRPYVAGQTSEFLPLYAGGIEDWVDGHLGIDNTFTIMMFRPSDSYDLKLITERVVHEAYAALDTLLLTKHGESLAAPTVKLVQRSNAPRSLQTNYIFLIMVIISSATAFYS